MDGFSAIEEIRKLGINTTIIALSGKVIDNEEELFFKQTNVHEVLTKPVTFSQVQDVLTKCKIIVKSK